MDFGRGAVVSKEPHPVHLRLLPHRLGGDEPPLACPGSQLLQQRRFLLQRQIGPPTPPSPLERDAFEPLVIVKVDPLMDGRGRDLARTAATAGALR
jgi:hypothetical protein